MYALILISVLQHERAFAFSAKHRVLEHIKGSFCSFPIANSELDFGDSGVCDGGGWWWGSLAVLQPCCALTAPPWGTEPHGEPFHGISVRCLQTGSLILLHTELPSLPVVRLQVAAANQINGLNNFFPSPRGCLQALIAPLSWGIQFLPVPLASPLRCLSFAILCTGQTMHSAQIEHCLQVPHTWSFLTTPSIKKNRASTILSVRNKPLPQHQCSPLS